MYRWKDISENLRPFNTSSRQTSRRYLISLNEQKFGSADREADDSTISLASLLTRTQHLTSKQWASISWFYRWLVMVRAVVLVMTVSSVAVGIILAAAQTILLWDRVIALVIGLTLAHACNNLINDWTDTRMGIDRENGFRRLYGTHALEDGLITLRGFWLTTIATASLALGCSIYLMMILGSDVLYLTIVGAFFVLFYTWPLKHYALGEFAVLLVWGPLLTAGSYFVLTELVSAQVLLISFVVGIGPTLVILGKHMDKIDHDQVRPVRTLPVAIGLDASKRLAISMLLAQWLILTYLIAAHSLYALVICGLTLPSIKPLLASLSKPPPNGQPSDYPDDVWPLYYSAYCFRYCRDFGFTLLAGLLVGTLAG
jgi:1,4-dihydroxy-2-naphthoate octaprenyltransferase